MLTIIFSWVFFGTAIYLIGRLVFSERVLKFLRITETAQWYEYFWVGLVAVFGILQIWSLFLPVNTLALVFIIVLAGISFFTIRKKGLNLPKLNIRFTAIMALLLLAISYFASLSVGWPDTYGYHLIAVKWANLYKVAPGLANLYTRLGFNSSFFLFASMIDNLILKDRSSHIALSLMASVLSIEFFWIYVKSKNNYLKVFVLLALPVFVGEIVHDVQVSSLSYDFAVSITILAACLELIEGNRKSVFIAVTLSFLLITIKLSGAVFASVVVIFGLYKLMLREKRSAGIFLYIVSIGFLLVAPYLVRNVILSGWPLYPLPSFGLRVPWAVPRERVADLFTVIKGWAIFGEGWQKIIGLSFLKWFPKWFLAKLGIIELRIFLLTILLILVSIPLKFFGRRTVGKNIGLGVCGLAAVASVFYLVYNAPDLRFGAIFFWVFFASVGSFFMVGLFQRVPYMSKLLMVLSILLTIYVSWPPRIDSEVMLKSVRWDQPGERDRVLVTPTDGSPPFKVYVAKSDSSCGNSELPCTSEVSNYFKEIIPGDISKGFAPTN